jgi:hypothetical protein
MRGIHVSNLGWLTDFTIQLFTGFLNPYRKIRLYFSPWNGPWLLRPNSFFMIHNSDFIQPYIIYVVDTALLKLSNQSLRLLGVDSWNTESRGAVVSALSSYSKVAGSNLGPEINHSRFAWSSSGFSGRYNYNDNFFKRIVHSSIWRAKLGMQLIKRK